MHFDERSDEAIEGSTGKMYLLPDPKGTLRPADRALDFSRLKTLHEVVVNEAWLTAPAHDAAHADGRRQRCAAGKILTVKARTLFW